MSFKYKAIQGKSLREIKSKVKASRPEHIVLIQVGAFYEAYGEDALFFKYNFGYETFHRQAVDVIKFPEFSKRVFYELESLNKSYVLVSQISSTYGGAKRAISKVFDRIESTNSQDDYIEKYQKINQIKKGFQPNYSTRDEVVRKGGKIVKNISSKATHVPKYEKSYETRKIQESFGSREDFNKMRGRQSFRNKVTK